MKSCCSILLSVTILCIFLVSTARRANAQNTPAQTSVITGTVRSTSGELLPGANVYLKETYDGATSNNEGFFKLTTSKTGEHILVVDYLGFEPFSQPISLPAKSLHIEVVLNETFNKLNAVTITAGVFEAGDKKRSNTLSSLDMVTTAGAVGDVYGALQTLPGTTPNGESGRLFVKGGDSRESQTFIDGALVHTPYNSSVPFYSTRGRFNPFMFKGTVFSTGGYSAEYGQALSGVLLLSTTDMPEQEQLDVSILSIGPELGGTKLWKTGAVTATAGYMNLAPYMQIVKQNNKYNHAPESASFSVSLKQKMPRNGMLRVYGNFDQARLNMAITDPDYSEPVDYNLRNRNIYMNTSLSMPVTPGIISFTSLSFTSDADNISFEGNKLTTTLSGMHLKETTSWEISNKLSLKAGAELLHRSVTRTFSTDSDTHRPSFDNSIVAAFVEAEVYTTKKFVVRAGSRLEYSDYLNSTHVAPRITTAYKLNDISQVSAAWGWFYQNPDDQFLLINNALDNERAEHLTLNYQASANDRTLRLEAYHKLYTSLIKYSGNSFMPENMTNQGKGYGSGFDLFWRDKKTIHNGDYWISYSFIDTKRNFLNYPEMSTPSFVSSHNLAVVYKHWFPNMRSLAGFNYRYASPRSYNDPNTQQFNSGKTSAYQSIDVSWSFLYRTNIIFYGAITNVTGFNNHYGHRFASTPDDTGHYNSTPIEPGSKRFFIIACFITLSKNKDLNQLDKIE